jgi:hypothetical protein
MQPPYGTSMPQSGAVHSIIYVGLSVHPARPLLPQLQTYRRVALTDVTGQEETFKITCNDQF